MKVIKAVEPKNDYILVREAPNAVTEQHMESGIIVPGITGENSVKKSSTVVRVIAVSKGTAFLPGQDTNPIEPPCKVGDLVIAAGNAPLIVVAGVHYLLIQFHQVLAVLTVEDVPDPSIVIPRPVLQ